MNTYSNNNITINIERNRNDNLTDFSKNTLQDRYIDLGEDYQELFARVATTNASNAEHAQRIYDYISKLWFMPATPVLSNSGTNRGLPISCFLNEANDNLESIAKLYTENFWLSARGGGIGSYWGNLRSLGEKVGRVGKTSGIIPFLKIQDSSTLAISQGSLRRGSAAVYLPIDHPEIEEFIELRRPTGDPNRRCLNLHHGVAITDEFMQAVENNKEFALRSPKDKEIQKVVSARSLWIRLLTARLETGEPYLLFIDHVNDLRPEHQKQLGLKIKTSNLCSEITLPTGHDHTGTRRTAVCCLSSLNLETYDEWKDDPMFILDVMEFLDNVLENFIRNAPKEFETAIYSAMRERSVGLGVMGFHGFLQSKNIPWESVMAKSFNLQIFNHIKEKTNEANEILAEQRGPNPDARESGFTKIRFSNKTAIAPTASISIIAGASPSIEPSAGNSYLHKTLSGSYTVRNKYLQKVLDKYEKNNQDVWNSIVANNGSVQHLAFLSDHEKDVFKTAFELDQRWVVQHAADRTPLIDQAQSLNLFLPANISKKDLHGIHFMAWKLGCKSLYYCRSRSIQRGEAVNNNEYSTTKTQIGDNKYDECLSCQ